MKKYFDYCFDHTQNIDANEILIIGDSLSSDIQGGINNIDTIGLILNIVKIESI